MGQGGAREGTWSVSEQFVHLGSGGDPGRRISHSLVAPRAPGLQILEGGEEIWASPAAQLGEGEGSSAPLHPAAGVNPIESPWPLFGQQRGVWPWFIPLWMFGDGFQHPRGDVGAGGDAAPPRGEAQVEGIRAEPGVAPGTSPPCVPREELVAWQKGLETSAGVVGEGEDSSGDACGESKWGQGNGEGLAVPWAGHGAGMLRVAPPQARSCCGFKQDKLRDRTSPRAPGGLETVSGFGDPKAPSSWRWGDFLSEGLALTRGPKRNRQHFTTPPKTRHGARCKAQLGLCHQLLLAFWPPAREQRPGRSCRAVRATPLSPHPWARCPRCQPRRGNACPDSLPSAHRGSSAELPGWK